MILGLLVDFTGTIYVEGEPVPDQHYPAAWLTLGSVFVEAGTVTAGFHLHPTRDAPETLLGDTYAFPESADPVGDAWRAVIAHEPWSAGEIVSRGLPQTWNVRGHANARLGALLRTGQHTQPIEEIDYDKVLGLVTVEVWDKGIQIRNDVYSPNDIVAYDPSGGPIPRPDALPPVSEYLDRADDPAGRKTIVWWHRTAGAPSKEIPPDLRAFPVYAYKRRAPSSNAEEKEIEWRTKVVARVLRVAAAGIVGWYAPRHPEIDPSTPLGLRALLDLERGYLYDAQQQFIGRGGLDLYQALVDSQKPWLDLPGFGGFATLRDRILDELTPWAV